jgi:hypothetical protein
MPYRRTQVGYVILALYGLGLSGMVFSSLWSERRIELFTVILAIAVCGSLFPTLTTVVETERVVCFFGPGLVRRTIPLADIVSASVVTNPWWYGWGLRLVPGGWSWSVSGRSAVELRLRSGRLFRVGTDDPVSLHAAISAALSIHA